MNGKKAKLFRSLAGVTSQTQEVRKYFGEKHTVRIKTVTPQHCQTQMMISK